MLNGYNVQLKESLDLSGPGIWKETIIVTDIEPKNLVYPEGWYYAKGSLRSKGTCTTGMYEEVRMEKSNGDGWEDTATYCTLD